MARSVQTKLDILMFSAKDEGFEYFAEQFEARMYALVLHKVLLDQITVPGEVENESSASNTARAKAESDLKENRYRLWCELVRCIDKRSVLLLRSLKGDVTTACKRLKEILKRSETPSNQK